MGQQQLLLLVVGALIVLLSIGVGIAWMSSESLDANRNAIRNDLILLATKAQKYYLTPVSADGGGNSFVGLTVEEGIQKLSSVEFANNSNATYTISQSGNATKVVFSAVSKMSNEEVTPEYTCEVLSNAYTITKVH